MTDRYDVVVAGGGIHGCGVAQAAAARGYSVLLLERTAIAAGTSSRSSRLIHGGLRYLEQGQIGLVRECLREREILTRLAPDLVRWRPFILPVFRRTRRRPWRIRCGLSLYALLAGLGSATRFRAIPRREWPDLDGLDTTCLDAVFEYRDAQTDDALLTQAVMHSALELGARLAMPAELTAAHVDGAGCAIRFREAGVDRSCSAAVLVNAAGPWAPEVVDRIAGVPACRPVDLVQGAHIVLPMRIERGIYYVESRRDGRAVFAMPHGAGRALVGTTETPFHGDPAGCAPTPGEIEYLVEVIRDHFPDAPTTVAGSFAGLRVLPAGTGRVFRRSRETILEVDRRRRPRVLTILGGKLTAYRATAEHVMDRLAPSLAPRTPIARTSALELRRPGDEPEPARSARAPE